MSYLKNRNFTVGKFLDNMVKIHPDKDALVCYERNLRYTYKEFQGVCTQFSKGLLKLGIKKGDHVAIWASNLPEWVIAQFGIAKIGAVLVTVNTSCKLEELEYLLKQSDSTALIMADVGRSNDYTRMIYEICPELYNCRPGELVAEKLPLLKNVITMGDKKYPGMLSLKDVYELGDKISDEEIGARMAELDSEDVCMMLYTSGTTGFPKGVMLSHKNVVMNALGMKVCMNLGFQDRVCIPVPLFHSFGAVAGVLCSVASGAAMVLPSERFDSAKVLEAVEKERCTVLHGVPAMFISLLEQIEKVNYDVSSLRTGIVAGAVCAPEVLRKLENVLNMKKVIVSYGQTEASPCITSTRVTEPAKLRHYTSGRALPGVEVKIVDPKTGEAVAPGVQGEIIARGCNVMKGYYKMPAATAEVIDDNNWLHTGDLGVIDDKGYCRITGRLKDMIICGGENIYPGEVENLLCTHPLVEEAQVLGLPSCRYGEEVMAFVQLKKGATLSQKDLQNFCKGKIATLKIPKYIAFVRSYPYTASGKVQKHKLRQLALSMLGDIQNNERAQSSKAIVM